MSKTKPKLGIIQTRGFGDIIIALPIALHYYEQDYEIFWPITDIWHEQLTHYVRWINWIPVKKDHGPFFWDIPQRELKKIGCDEILCLYNALTGHPEFSNEPYFQFTTFDQYKYVKAGVPFKDKWRLNECISRDMDREMTLYNKLVKNPHYVVTHLNSSEHTVRFDHSAIPTDWDTIPITDEGWIFDWITIIDKAESIVMTNSVFSNLTDQLNLGTDRYFIPLHHMNWSPTFAQTWTWLPNPDLPPHHKTVGTPR